MANLNFFENIINNKILNLHTAYLASVIAVNGTTAKIQPLGMVKAYGENAKVQSPLTNVPMLTSVVDDIVAGCVVLCVCCERDITAAKQGRNVLPPVGSHSMSDSVIVGVLA